MSGYTKPNLVLLMAVTAVASFAAHVFSPAMPAAAQELGVTPGAMQLNFTIYAVGLAVGHLFVGPWSDRFGRRPVMLASLVLFVLATFGAAFADNMGQLLAARLFQALGASATPVVGRAMARDGATDTTDAARQMAVLGLAVSGSPVFAPLIGGVIAEFLGWRGIFQFMAWFALLMLAICHWKLPETRRPAAGGTAERGMIEGVGVLLRTRQFRGYMLGCSVAVGAVYALLATLPFIYAELLGLSAGQIGSCLLVLALGFSAGTFLSLRLVGRVGPRTMVVTGSLVGLAAGPALLIVHLTGNVNIVTVTGASVLLLTGNGMMMPNAVAVSMAIEPRLAGTASGLFAASLQFIGGLCAAVTSVIYDHTLLPAALFLIVLSGLGQFFLQYDTRSST